MILARRRSGSSTSRLYDAAGQAIELGARLGKGGEGSVYEVVGDRQRVAKVYHREPQLEQAEKLQAMVRCGTERLLKLAAWPVATLHARGGRLQGLMMRRAEGSAIHLLYGPKSRREQFPEATWAFLVAAAANVARAVGVIHEHDHVVGDVNQGNILVALRATVRLIDCDSFQIRDGDHIYLCEVGVGPYVPPELQHRSLHVLRTPNHDVFGVAVLAFQLLFLGRHPFSGRFLGSGDLAIEQAIQEFRFAYGAGAAAHQMRQPPATPPLGIVSPDVANLFERAFAPAGAHAGGRPAAGEWVTALTKLGGELCTCVANPVHEYWKALAGCPWCPVEKASHTALFDLLGRSGQVVAPIDLPGLWARIRAVPSPGPAPQFTHLPRKLPPSDRARWMRTPWLLAVPIGVLCFDGLANGGRAGDLFGAGIWEAAILLAFLGISLLARNRARLAAAVAEARGLLQLLQNQWPVLAGDHAFAQRRRQLERHRQQHLHLADLRLERLAELQRSLPAAQRRKFLRQFPVERAPQMNANLCATLRSYGIETAADVEPAALSQVPGIDGWLDRRLLAWRAALERRFRFDPSRGAAVEETALERELASLRAQLEQDLLRGEADLRQLYQACMQQRISSRHHLDQAARAVDQAEADQRFGIF